MTRAHLFAVLAVLALFALCGCDNDTTNVVDGPGGDVPLTDKTCLGCHASQDELLAALGETEPKSADIQSANFSVYDKSDG